LAEISSKKVISYAYATQKKNQLYKLTNHQKNLPNLHLPNIKQQHLVNLI